jgi:hypothetical protein
MLQEKLDRKFHESSQQKTIIYQMENTQTNEENKEELNNFETSKLGSQE